MLKISEIRELSYTQLIEINNSFAKLYLSKGERYLPEVENYYNLKWMQLNHLFN